METDSFFFLEKAKKLAFTIELKRESLWSFLR